MPMYILTASQISMCYMRKSASRYANNLDSTYLKLEVGSCSF